MKKILFTLICLQGVFAFGQNAEFIWAKSMGGTGGDRGTSIATDVFGNIYTTGYFVGTVDFDPGAGITNLAAIGSSDIFVQKVDTDGIFLWAKSFGGIYSEQSSSISTDALGNIYIIGRFEGTVDFDPGAGVTNLTSAGGYDVFVQKMDTDGNFLWVKSFGGIYSEYSSSISIDALGNVYTTGYFQGTVDFDPGIGTTNLTAVGSADNFVQKMDTDGNFLWARSFGSINIDNSQSISIDVSGNVYTTGNFWGTVDFDPGTGTHNLTSAGGYDIFVQKMDTDGNFMWAKSFGGINNDLGYSISVDALGNVYTTGDFHETVDFNPGAGTNNLISEGGRDIFVQKMDTDGNFLWAKSFGGSNDDYGYSISIDALYNVYTTGSFQETVDFDPEAETFNLTSAGNYDVFILKLGNNCSAVTHSISETACTSFTWTDGNGQTYTESTTATHTIVGGAANGCDSTITLNLTINQPTNSLVSATQCGSYTWAVNNQTYTSSGSYTHIIPNANNCDSIITLNLTINNVDNTTSVSGITLTANQAGANYQWVDCNNGNTPISGATAQSFTPTVNGNYAVEVTINGCTETSSCIAVNSVGIKSLEQNGWSVYPNPTNGMFAITSVEVLNNATVEIYSALGQLIYSSVHSGNNVVIDLEEQPTGIYVLKVNNQQYSRIIKL